MSGGPDAPSTEAGVVLRAARIFDGAGDVEAGPVDRTVEAGVITDVGRKVRCRDHDLVVDLGDDLASAGGVDFVMLGGRIVRALGDRRATPVLVGSELV